MSTSNNKQDEQKEKEEEEGYYRLVNIPIVEAASGQELVLEGDLSIPKNAQGVVIFAHGSGSSRHSPRNRYVAQVLQNEGIATLLIDLLTEQEEEIDLQTRHLRFDIGLLAQRLVGATDWLTTKEEEQNLQTIDLKVGYFGASTGAAAALVAAAERLNIINAVVSRGGRPDLAGIDTLQKVQASTLLIVGGNDVPVIDMNKQAYDEMCMLKEDNGNNNYNHNNKYKKKKLVIIPGATHLFEEPGKLEEVAHLAAEWFGSYLK